MLLFVTLIGGVVSSTALFQVGLWKENLAMQSFPTNAYGTITFDGSLSKVYSRLPVTTRRWSSIFFAQAAKYVRLGPKTEMSKVKELLTEVWGLTR